MGTSRRRLKILAIAVVALAVIYGAVSWVFSDQLIGRKFKPLGPVEIASYGLPHPADARIAGDGGVSLASWYFANPRKANCSVVMLHGFSGTKAEVLAAGPIFWDRGCDLLLYDARGHGESSRSLLTFGAHERKDLARVIDWLARKTRLPRSRIGLIGWSYGAATAIQTASEMHGVSFVIADSSFSSLGDIARVQADKQFGAWAKVFVPGALLVSSIRGGFDARDVSPASAIRKVTAPTLLIHSRQDKFTPVQQSELIYAHSNKAHTELVIPSWKAEHGHSFTVNPVGYTAVVDKFLARFTPDFGVRLKRSSARRAA